MMYNKVLDNCGFRREADMKNINKYLKEYKNWKDIVIERHHVFVNAYITNKCNLNKMSKDIEYPVKSLLSIFLRIESQFELYKYPNKEINKDFKDKKKINKSVYIKRKNSRFSKAKEEIVYDILKEIKHINNLDIILPTSLYAIVKELQSGLTIRQLAEKRNGSAEYLINAIVGIRKPRNNSEKGIRLLIDEYNLKNIRG